jgi:DNA-binding CsgD family transcriptional regulator
MEISLHCAKPPASTAAWPEAEKLLLSGERNTGPNLDRLLMNDHPMNRNPENPFEDLHDEDAIWQCLQACVQQRFGITSVLYAFTHSRYTASRTGFTSSLFLHHNLPDDYVASFPDGLTLDDDIASEQVVAGVREILWSDFDKLDLRPVQRKRRSLDKTLGMDVGVTFGLRFGGTSGFGGMCWARRHTTAHEFELIWQSRHTEMTTLARQFDQAMRPVMVGNRFKPTPRELEVMSYSAGGMTSKQIADHLALSPKTIANTLERARKSMQAVSTMEAVAKALVYELIG